MNETIILIPTLNEAKGIGPTISEIVKDVKEAQIIVVDQNSGDGTAQIAAGLGAKVITQFERGKGRAIAEGLSYVRKSDPEWLVLYDGDFSYLAEYIPKMINILIEKPDIGMVVGTQYFSYIEHYTLWKRIKWIYLSGYVFFHRTLIILHWILNGVNMHAPLSGQRIIRYKCIKDFRPKSKGFDIEVEINCHIQKTGYKILEIPTRVRYRIGRAKFHRFTHFLIILRRIVIERFN